jgi:RNA polymerase primary sigma factor
MKTSRSKRASQTAVMKKEAEEKLQTPLSSELSTPDGEGEQVWATHAQSRTGKMKTSRSKRTSQTAVVKKEAEERPYSSEILTLLEEQELEMHTQSGKSRIKISRHRRTSQIAVLKEAEEITQTTFSSDLLTPEEERDLLTNFWECKSDLVRVLKRYVDKASWPAMEPWPMAQFIREHCTPELRQEVAIRRLYERYVHYKHRLASANIRLAAHVAKRFRHHSLAYSDLLQEAVCGLMQAIDRFDVSHGTRLATYATWWIRQTLQIAVARQSHLVSLSPHHLQELGQLQQESEALAHGGKHLPSPQELASRTGSSLEHLTHLQTATRTPVSLNAVLDDDSDFKLTEAMPDTSAQTAQENNERQEALNYLMESLRPRERKVLDLRFGLTGNGTHSLRQIGHMLRISKERVRQIQNRALEKLRANAERVGWEPNLLLE